MSLVEIMSGLLVAAGFAYLLLAMLRPEDF
jgi:K+-transporting ATPase KdpF subunit